jgi:hypothetical protein
VIYYKSAELLKNSFIKYKFSKVNFKGMLEDYLLTTDSAQIEYLTAMRVMVGAALLYTFTVSKI